MSWPGMPPACSRAAQLAPRTDDGLVRVLVASSNGELCRTIAEACFAAGYRVEQASDQVVGQSVRTLAEPMASAEVLLTVWDVPVLEAWTERLERHALQHGPLVVPSDLQIEIWSPSRSPRGRSPVSNCL